MDLTLSNVFLKTTINWDETSLYSGITPIKKSHIQEIADAISIISQGIDMHAAKYDLDTVHGRVSTLNSGFLTKELFNSIENIKNNFNTLIDIIPEKVSPPKLITAFDKSPALIPNGYKWCNGESSTPNTKGKVLLGAFSASMVDDFPDGKAATLKTTSALTPQTTVRATFIERV